MVRGMQVLVPHPTGGLVPYPPTAEAPRPPTEEEEVMVSDEEYYAAWDVIAGVRDQYHRDPRDADTGDIVEALIMHGWGPLPDSGQG